MSYKYDRVINAMIVDAQDAINGSLYSVQHLERVRVMSANAATIPGYEHFLKGPLCQVSEEGAAFIIGRAAEGKRSSENALRLKRQKL